MLVTNTLQRAFYMELENQEIRLDDPGNTMSPQAVLNFYANTYPVLTTAKIEGPEIKDDEIQFQFVTTIGTKG